MQGVIAGNHKVKLLPILMYFPWSPHPTIPHLQTQISDLQQLTRFDTKCWIHLYLPTKVCQQTLNPCLGVATARSEESKALQDQMELTNASHSRHLPQRLASQEWKTPHTLHAPTLEMCFKLQLTESKITVVLKLTKKKRKRTMCAQSFVNNYC